MRYFLLLVLAVAVLAAIWRIGGNDDVQMPEGVSPSEDGESPVASATRGHLVQGSPESAYGSVPDGGRNALGEASLDVDAMPGPPWDVATPLVPDVPEPTAPAGTEVDQPAKSQPTPTPAPSGVPTGQYGDPASPVEIAPVEGDVVSIIHEVFGVNAGAALAVAWCESRFNPNTVGAARERGLFQIHPVHWDWLDEDLLFDPLYNAQMAFELSRGGTNWSSWTCKP